MDFNLEGKTVFTGDVLTLDPGTYRVSNASTNLPAANNFNMMVIQRNENWKTIIALSDANLIYTNTKNNGTWMGWSQLTSIIETVITRTTSSEGNIILTNADVAYKTPIFSSLSGVSGFVGVCSISRYSGSWVIHVADTNGNAKSNTEFTIAVKCV